MTDEELIERLRKPLTAGMFLNLSALVEELQRQREEAADCIEADAKRIAELEAALRNLSDCVDDGCFCSEMRMAAAMDAARELVPMMCDRIEADAKRIAELEEERDAHTHHC